MISKNVRAGYTLGIALGTIALVILLLDVNYGAGANPSPITENNNSSSETGITYTQEVPFAKESIKDIIERESKRPAPIPKQRVIPFRKGPQAEKLPGQAGPQSALPQETTGFPLAPALGSNFTGLSDNNQVIPPDTMGAVGPSYLLETLNSEVGIFNKNTGALISNVSLQAFWSSLGTGAGQPANFPFDPKALYDQSSGRFIVVTLGGTSSPSSWLMIAVSNTSDPNGIWNKWAIDADQNSGNWADYPGLGVDANNVYVSANMFSNAGNYQYSKVWVIPKAQLLNGTSSITFTIFSNPAGSGFTMQPAHVFGSSSTEYFIHEDYGCPDPTFPCLKLNNITFPGGTPTWNTIGDIVVNSYSGLSFPDAPQLGSSNGIETNDRRLLNAIFRNGSLWTAHTVRNSTYAKTDVAWYQIDPARATPSLPFGTPVQQGRISNTSRWYYFPSIAVNSYNDVGIGFSGSSSTEYAGAYYTARKSSDPPGTMQSVALLKAGLAPYYKTYGGTSNRWGDYSATAVDPGDNATFWTLQEYANSPSNTWGTWWGKFAITQTGSPIITSWRNNKTNDNALALVININESVRFNATANQIINIWNWSRDSIIQSNNFDNFTTSWGTVGNHTVSVNGTNTNGTTQTIAWVVIVQAPSYIPPSPVNLTSTRGNFWINYTWQAGSGNVTSSYNVSVNGTWTNGSARNYSNNSGLAPHGWSNISVYSFNSSGTGTMNVTPVSGNTQLLNNPVTISNVSAGYTLTAGDTLSVYPASSDPDSDTPIFGRNFTNGTFYANNGTLLWPTASSDTGIHSWQINVTDGYGSVSRANFTVTVNAAAYIPPSPTGLSSTRGNFWINHTWQPGSGNVTDSYNVSVNGTWTNGTALTYSNGTVLPHGWSNITIFAYNNSGFASSPVSDNTQAANNIPVLDPIENKTVPAGQFLNFTVHATDADSDALTYGTNATGGTLDNITGSYSWLPAGSDAGIYVWEFNAGDGYGGVAARAVTVTVLPPQTFNISGFKINARDGSGIPGWNITLGNSTGAITAISTGSNGSYEFSGLVNGTYNVTEEMKTGFTNITPLSQVATITGQDITNLNFTNMPNATISPLIYFTDPTPADGATLAQDYAYINTTVSDSSNTTAFIDWNRSLVGWWRFNNESGESSSFFRDWSSWGNNGTCSGPGCPNSTTGMFGNALAFDGVNDYVSAGNSPSLNITDALTIEAWIKFLNLSDGYGTAITKGYTGSSATTPWMFYPSGTTTFRFYAANSTGGRTNVLLGSSLSNGVWYHFVGVYNGTHLIPYKNGVAGTSAYLGGNLLSNTGNVFIGYKWGSRYFNGTIDEVRIYNRALSSDEIKASYNAGVYRLSRNFTNLTNGVYNYRAYAQNLYGNVNQTEMRTLTVPTPPPSITGFAPQSPVSNIVGDSRNFNITASQIVNITWYINGTQVQFNESVSSAAYVNTSGSIGTWNVSAVARNDNGTAMQTWIWTVSNLAIIPSISFTDPTPPDGATLTQNYAYINTTVTDSSNTTAFIDWNRSLVGWWRFNNESGESPAFFRDWSSWGNNGTCSGPSCPVSTTGVFGNALSFDGVNDYIDAGNSPSLNITKEITIEAWINFKSLGDGNGTIITKGYTGSSATTPWMFYPSGATTLRFYAANSTGGRTNVLLGSSLSNGVWYHFVGVYNGTYLIPYKNGVAGTSVYLGGNFLSNTGDVFIGYKWGSRYFNGTIDEVRIHNRALSSDEIKASYNAGMYRLSRNFTNLPEGVYNYRAYAQNLYGNVNQTEIRTLNISGAIPP